VSDVKAIVRQHFERIDGVTRTWFEWSREEDAMVKTLVVEVAFDTDPNSPQHRPNVLDHRRYSYRGFAQRDDYGSDPPKNRPTHQLADELHRGPPGQTALNATSSNSAPV
jgi:hypothetical protein